MIGALWIVALSWSLTRSRSECPTAVVSSRPGRELVQQRLEGVVVVPVDEHDVDVGVLQLPRGADPGEAAAENEDPRSLTAGRRQARRCRPDCLGSLRRLAGQCVSTPSRTRINLMHAPASR